MRGLLGGLTFSHAAMVARKQGRCPICQRQGKPSNEDIWPQWARRKASSEGAHLTRLKMRICEDCNTRSGKLFEDKAASILKPMIDGHRVQLNPGQQVVVAAWFAKTSLMIDLKEQQGKKAVGPPSHIGLFEETRTYLLNMLETGLPPATASVGLGVFWPERDNMLGQRYRPTRPGPKPNIRLSGAIGRLLYRVLIGRTLRKVLPFENRPEDNNWLITVWPQHISKTLVWPTPLPFGHDDLAAMMQEVTYGYPPTLRHY